MGLTRSFSFILISALLLFTCDVNINGSYKASKTRSLLKELGILKQVETAVSSFRSSSQQAYRWCQKNVPLYIAKTREKFVPFLINASQVIVNLALQLWSNFKRLFQYFLSKKSAAQKWVDGYSPGLWDKSADWLRQTSDWVRDFTSQMIVLLVKFMNTASQWLKDNVFIKSLSPESIRRLSLQALHSTQQLVSSAMSWLSDNLIAATSAT